MAQKSTSRTKVALGVALAVVMALLIAWCVFLVRDKLLSNAERMGSSLASTYAAEEENRFSMYTYFLGLGYTYLSDMVSAGASEDELSAWLGVYKSHLDEVLGAEIIDPYAVVDGRLIAAIPWEGSASYDYTSSAWYQNAQADPGHITYTDAYVDAATGEQLVTLSIAMRDSENVVAFDIRLANLNAARGNASIPAEGSYFLFDTEGTLLYASTDLDLTRPESQSYLRKLQEGIRADSDGNATITIADADGMNRNVYYSQMANGWMSVITIPTQVILQEGWDLTLLAIAVVFVAILLVAGAFMVRSALEERKARHTADTLRLLGDTFYAIYRVDYQRGIYEAIKSSPDVKSELGSYGEKGDYQRLIDVVKKYVDERTYSEFEKSFSLENIRALVAEGVSEFGGDFRRTFPDGARWVSIRIVHNSDLRLNEVVMCFRDVDREKKGELMRKELLENALASARQTVERKASYFSNASHDMRTPLNAIIGLTELAKRDLGDEGKTRAYLDKIEGAGDQLLALVNDVLDMSRMEHGDSGMVNYAPMSLTACVDATLGLFSEQAAREGKHLGVTIDIEHDRVYGDSKRLSQILNNLVSNALKYSLEGASVSVSLRETAHTERTAKYQLDVADTGIGMSEEFLKQVFEPFARETMFAPKGVTGTGLGMPIVKSLVQQMSGEISVRSELGQGSTFTVVVPLQIVEEEAERGAGADGAADAENAAGSADVEGAAGPLDLTGRTLLVVEDNEINMLIATEFLSSLGATVVEAHNGQEALEEFGRSQVGAFDAILMDMQMPVMDGCDATRAIRALDREDAASVPIVAVTANAFAEDIARTTEAGMNGHVAKPFTVEELTDVLGKLMR